MENGKKLVWFSNPPQPGQELLDLTWGYLTIGPNGIIFDDSERPSDKEIKASDLYRSEMQRRDQS